MSKPDKSNKPQRPKQANAKARKPAADAAAAKRRADAALAATGMEQALGVLAPHREPPRQDLCVFAFRLTEEERDAIHLAAGPAKASKFARALLVAAARNDHSAIKAIMEGVQIPR